MLKITFLNLNKSKQEAGNEPTSVFSYELVVTHRRFAWVLNMQNHHTHLICTLGGGVIGWAQYCCCRPEAEDLSGFALICATTV